MRSHLLQNCITLFILITIFGLAFQMRVKTGTTQNQVIDQSSLTPQAGDNIDPSVVSDSGNGAENRRSPPNLDPNNNEYTVETEVCYPDPDDVTQVI